MKTKIQFRGKVIDVIITYTEDQKSMKSYDLALEQGADHMDAANFQGWTELASVGECYDSNYFYAEII